MPQINPYAPSSSSPAAGFPSLEWTGGVSSIRVCVVTIGAVASSGGLFGAGMMLFSMIGRSFSYPDGPTPMEVLPAVVFGGVGGALYAGIAATIVVPLTFLLGFYLRDRAFPWNGMRIRLLATASGFLTGAGCVVVPSLPRFVIMPRRGTIDASDLFEIITFSLIPGAVGLVGTWLITEPMARRANREAIRRESAAPETVPLSGLEPSKYDENQEASHFPR